MAAEDVAEGRSQAMASAGSTGATMTAALFALRRMQRRAPPGPRRPAAGPGAPARRRCCSTWAPTPTPGRTTWCSSPTWAPPSSRRCSGSPQPRVALLSVGEEANKGTAEVVDAHAAARRAPTGLDFRGNLEGARPARRGGRRDRHRRVHRQRRPEDDRGHGQDRGRRGARRGPLGGPGGRGRASASPVAGRPAPPDGPGHDGRRDPAGPARRCGGRLTAARGRTGIANAVRLAARAVEERAVERTSELLEGPG